MARNPFLNRIAEQGQTGHGRASEKRVIAGLGARPMPASGAMDSAKSDAVLRDFRLELKSTTNKTMALEQGWLTKISDEARAHGQVPALILSFVDGDGRPVMRHDAEWACVPLSWFKEVVGE